MSAASVVAVVVLVGIAIALSVARFRSQSRLRNTTSRLERSQRKLSASLETLSDVMGTPVAKVFW
jgi:hypothetical protein